MKTVIGLVAAVVALLVAACFVLDRLNRPQREQLTPGKKGILCIGDSITFGTGVMFSRKKNCWVYKLSERLPGWQALDYGCKVAGVTVHFVDAGTDSGPIIVQKCVPVLEDDTPETLHARIQVQEHLAFPEALRHLAAGRLRVEGRRVRIVV